MSKPLRFIVDVDAGWQVTILDADEQPLLEPRQMCQIDDGRGGRFPQPPQDALPANGDPHYPLCVAGASAPGDIWQVYDRIAKRNPVGDAIITFGRYLFDTLLGREAWKRIEERAKPAPLIELALRWSHKDTYLHRLNWEMMCCKQPDPHGFLAGGHPKRVAITRIVAGTAHPARHLGSPPKILFVVGASANDKDIRPGLELMGLLERLSKNRRTVHSEILLDATPSKLREKMDRFCPDIVHFVCHGHFDAQGSYLKMQKDESGADDRRYAMHLLKDLKVGEVLPPIVVLSACYSAVSQGVHLMGPLAAQLVEGGVPVVVGMGGRVSDLACRLFTRRFGEALLLGEPLVTATAEGRIAALYGGQLAQQSVDWAFPTLFLSAKVKPDYVPSQLQAGVKDRAVVIEDRLTYYGVEVSPVFCDRYEFFDVYHRLLNPGDKASALAIYVEKGDPPGLGKTRLLKELAARAVRDGYVPCLVGDNLEKNPQEWEPLFGNVTELGLEILKAIAQARRAFGLVPPLDSWLLKQIVYTMPPDLKNKVESMRTDFAPKPNQAWEMLLAECKEFGASLAVGVVKAALRDDLEDLATEVCQQPGNPERPEGEPVVLLFLDEVDQYGAEATRHLIGILADDYGLGTEKRPVPVILAFSRGGPAGGILSPWVEEERPKWLVPKRLEPFRQEAQYPLAAEDMQAYERVLLHPFKGDLVPGVSDRTLAINDPLDDKTMTAWTVAFRNMLKGNPKRAFEGDTLWGLAQAALQAGFLVRGDDKAVLEKLRTGGGSGG